MSDAESYEATDRESEVFEEEDGVVIEDEMIIETNENENFSDKQRAYLEIKQVD